MKINKSIILILLSLMAFLSCENYVTNVDPLIDAVEDEKLDTESQVSFIIKGVKAQFALTIDFMFVASDGLSDAFIFDQRVPNATYPQFAEIDQGDLGYPYDNNTVDNTYDPLGELRLYSDDLIRRVNSIILSDTSLKREALFNGNLYGGIARYFYASYFGLNPTEGGGIIDNGPFIPSNEMYGLAIEKFTEALKYTDFDYTDQPVISSKDHAEKIVHSLIARAYLYKGDYANAATHAALGMQNGDEPFQSLHFVGGDQEDNYWWQQAGDLRSQFVVDFRFLDYVEADADEYNRIIITPVITTGGDTVKNDDGRAFHYQILYDQTSPIDFFSWQENNLILAELAIRGHGGGDALSLTNEVRSFHGISDLASIDMNGLIIERDKELWTRGARLVDQRRYDMWHLPAGTWQYLCITANERNNNPNIN